MREKGARWVGGVGSARWQGARARGRRAGGRSTRRPPNLHRVLAWHKEFADARGLSWAQDGVGNIVISRPGGGGGEAAPPVVIQAGRGCGG